MQILHVHLVRSSFSSTRAPCEGHTRRTGPCQLNRAGTPELAYTVPEYSVSFGVSSKTICCVFTDLKLCLPLNKGLPSEHPSPETASPSTMYQFLTLRVRHYIASDYYVSTRALCGGLASPSEFCGSCNHSLTEISLYCIVSILHNFRSTYTHNCQHDVACVYSFCPLE